MTGLKVAASNIGWAEADDGRVLERMVELGFTGLEIAPTRVFANRPYSKVREFAAWAGEIEARYGLSVCSMQSIWRGRAESIFDDAGALALVDYTAEACNFAAAGGVKNLVFGCPSNRSVPQGHDGLEAPVSNGSCSARKCSWNTLAFSQSSMRYWAPMTPGSISPTKPPCMHWPVAIIRCM